MDLISLALEISLAQKAIAIFLFTLILMIWQPRGLGIGFSALIGAILAIASGVVTWKHLLEVWDISWNSTFTFIALTTISLILNEAGFLRWLALHLVSWGQNKSWLLWILVMIVAAALTAVLTNYGTALIWLPIILEITLALGYQTSAIVAFVITTSFIADAASLPLQISNLTNIISSDYWQISFWRYALVMVPVNFVTIIVSLGVLWFYFQRYVPAKYNFSQLEEPSSAIRDPLICKASFIILTALLVGLFIATKLAIPTCLITGLAACIMLALALRLFPSHQRSIINIRKIIFTVPWQVILFSLGMYLLVISLRNTELITLLSKAHQYLSHWGITIASMGTALLASIMSSTMNQLPVVLLNSMAIRNIAPNINDPAIREAMVYANIIGCNLGAKITSIGSLTTLLCLNLLAKKKIYISWSEYIRMGIVLTIPVLFATLLSLAIWLPWLIA